MYEQVYRRSNFLFTQNGKPYTQRVINVTFQYANKVYNRVRKDVYLKFGWQYSEAVLTDCACVQNGELIAIQVGVPVKTPLPKEILGRYFYYADGMYQAKANITTLHSVNNLRETLYRDGFYCDGIHYIRFKRSSGSSRVGKCLFIDENLYSRMHRWELCGIRPRKHQKIDLAALESYISLTLSSIMDTMELYPENILIIDDYESTFRDNVIAVSEDNHGWLQAKPDTVEICNSIWDGQSLLDASLFGKYSQYGFLLLRNRFFKSACFNCNLQDWFRENGITTISQLNGFTLARRIENVKLITTPSSIKYCKFGNVQDWLAQLDPVFGIVKHEKPPHFFDGRMVQTHYQLLNTLQMNEDETQAFLQPTLDYLALLKTDPDVVRYHIRYPTDQQLSPAPLLTKNEIVYRMLGINNQFAETKLYAGFLQDLVKAFVKNIRCGHILAEGNYSTMLGNGVEMLQSAIGQFDGKSVLPAGTVHSKRFAFGETLLGSRSPHVCNGNVWLTTNTAHAEIDRYFNLSSEIVYVNSIGENLLQRLNGADFDSDTVLLTNNHHLIAAAQKNYDQFKVPTNLVQAKKVRRQYTAGELTDLDIKTSVNKIGEIINLSQELNTQLWHRMHAGATYAEVEPLYCDIVKLAVLSNLEIDRAKKEFVINAAQEIKKLKQKYHLVNSDGKKIKPNFFGHIARQKGYYDPTKKAYVRHATTMDYLQKCINRFQVRKKKTAGYYPFSHMLEFGGYQPNHVYRDQARRIIQMIREMKSRIHSIWAEDTPGFDDDAKQQLVWEAKAHAIEYINQAKMNPHTMFWLLQTIEDDNHTDIARTILNTLFGAPSKDFFGLIAKAKEPLYTLVETPGGDLTLYDFQYKKVFTGSEVQVA